MKSIHYPHSNTSVDEANALESRYERIKLPQVYDAFGSAGLNLTPIKIRKPESYGTRHVIYIVSVRETSEEYVFRSNIGYGTPEVVLAREKLITDMASSAGVLVNEILYVDISRKHVPFDFQIHRTVPGQDLEDHFTGSQAEYDAISIQLGEITANLHKIQMNGFGRFDLRSTQTDLVGDLNSNADYIFLGLGNELKMLVESGTIIPAQSKKIKEYFDSRIDLMSIEQGVLLHYDIADHNIMFKDSKVTGLVDWEAAVSSDPVLDIASMPTWKTHYPRLEKFLEGYRKVLPLPENFEEKYVLYELRTLLWKTVFCLNAGILNEARIKRFTDCLERVGI